MWGYIVKILLLKYRKIEFNKSSKLEVFVDFTNPRSVKKALSLNNTKINDVILKISKFTKINFNNLRNSSLDDFNDDEENSQNFDNFMTEYKQYFKYTHKYQKKIQNKKEGEINIPELLSQANSMYLSNQYDEAISILHQIITHSSDLQEPYQVLSLIYQEKGDIAKALDFLMLAAELSHGESEIWIRCANLNKKIKNLHQAEYCLTRALKVEKFNTYLLYERAVILEELGQLKKAAKIYEKILRISPNPEILIHISQIYEKLNLIDKSIEVLQSNYESLSRKMKVLYKLFDMYIKYEKYLQGFYFYQTVVSYSNDNYNYQNISYVKLRYLFCCLELSMSNIDLQLIKNEIDDRTLMQEMIMDKEKFIKEEDHSTVNLLKSLHDSQSIINDITSEFKKICSGIDIENNLELLYKLFEILQRSNKIDQFISIYEILEKIFENQEYSDLTPTWGVINSGIFQLTPEIYLKIADHFFNLKSYVKSIEFYNKCLKFMKKNSFNNSDEVMIRFRLSEIYKIQGNFTAALEVLNSENGANDNILNEEIIYEKINKNKTFDNLKDDLIDRNNPFDRDEILDRNFLKNQIEDNYEELEEENDKLENENLIDQNKQLFDDNFNIPYEFNRDLSFKDLKEFKIPKPSYNASNLSQISNNVRKSQYGYSDFRSSFAPTYNSHSRKNLGKKRIRFTHSRSNTTIENYNFETYLKRRNTIKSSENTSNSTMKNINSLKIEYDELQEEINSQRNLYMKLQESLIYIQTNNETMFLENTFEPLKQTIIQELKIEDFKYQLFQNILEKSNIKNFFNVKDTIFVEKNDIQRRLSGVTSYDQYFEEDDEMLNFATKIKDNLFVRKTCSNLILSRKKVTKTMDLVLKQISNFQNIDKFMPTEKFVELIITFVKLAYKNKKYQESAMILQLILNSENFNQRFDAVLFNMYVYTILTNVKLNNYKIAFIHMKKLMSQYQLKDIPAIWIFLWNIGKNINISYLRSFFYKLSLSDHDDNIYLRTLIGNCYLQTGNWDLSRKNLETLNYREFGQDPFLHLDLGLNHLYKSMSRNNKQKLLSLMKANDFFNDYAFARIRTNPFEGQFNLGRFYQFIGHDTEAYKKYNEILANICLNVSENTNCSDEDKELIYLSTIYNYSLMLKKGGNEKEAHKLLINNIII